MPHLLDDNLRSKTVFTTVQQLQRFVKLNEKNQNQKSKIRERANQEMRKKRITKIDKL